MEYQTCSPLVCILIGLKCTSKSRCEDGMRLRQEKQSKTLANYTQIKRTRQIASLQNEEHDGKREKIKRIFVIREMERFS